jgi:DNA-binding transcriptional LysR family regulator
MAVRPEDLFSMMLFAHVVELRSFSAAALKVGLAKSTVSKRISSLEHLLGVSLLSRTTRKLALTQDGVRFYEHCRAMLASANAAVDTVTSSSQSARGVLRVNAPVTFSQMHLARAVAQFVLRHPEIELHLVTDDRIVDLVDGGFDVVVRISRLEDSSLVARRLATDRLVVCASPEYLARAGTPQSPADLVHHNCLHYGLVPLDKEWRFRFQGKAAAMPVHGNMVTSDGTVLRQATLAGLGLAVLPLFMVAADIKAGRLRTVLDGFRRAEIGIYAVFVNRKHLPLRTKLFLDHLSDYFADARWKER